MLSSLFNHLPSLSIQHDEWDVEHHTGLSTAAKTSLFLLHVAEEPISLTTDHCLSVFCMQGKKQSLENTKLCYCTRTTRRATATNPQQITVMELEHYSWLTCSKQQCRVHHRTCGQQTRLSKSCVDKTIDLLLKNYLSPEFGTNFQYPYFWRQPNFLTTQHKIALSIQSFRYNTSLW